MTACYWTFNLRKLILKESNVLFQASRLCQSCGFSVAHSLCWALHGRGHLGNLNQAWRHGDNGESIWDSLSFLHFSQSFGLNVVSPRETSQNKQSWENCVTSLQVCINSQFRRSRRAGVWLGWHMKGRGQKTPKHKEKVQELCTFTDTVPCPGTACSNHLPCSSHSYSSFKTKVKQSPFFLISSPYLSRKHKFHSPLFS